MSEEVIEQPTEEAAAPVEAVVEEQPEPQGTELDADNLDAQLEAQAIQIPDGDKLVPLSAVLNARDKLKVAKETAAKVPALEQKAQELEAKLSQLQPAAEALRALQAAAQAHQQPRQPTGPTAEDTAEAEQFARDFDLYNTEGKPDIDRATKIIARNKDTIAKTAQQIASQYVAPLVNRTVAQDVALNYERAKISELNGIKPDPAILKSYFDRMSQTPDGIKQLTNPDAVAIIAKQAIIDTWAAGKGTPTEKKPAATAKEPLPEPIFTEKSGGQDVAGGSFTMSANEIKLAKELNPSLPEAQAIAAYKRTAAKKPW